MPKRKPLVLALGTGVVLAALCVSGMAFAAGSYIDMEMGPRPQAMGGAFVAVADDINASYWNPAGIPQLELPVAGFMHSSPFNVAALSLDYLAFVHPTALGSTGGLGISYQRVAALLDEGAPSSTNQMDESIYTLSLGSKLSEYLMYGVNAKAISLNTSVGDSSTGYAFDFGVLYLLSPEYSIGFTVRNLAGNLSNETIPIEKRIGLAGRFAEGKLTVALDASSKEEVNSAGEAWRLHYGAELKASENIAVRVGVDRGSFTAGLGLAFDFDGAIEGASLDYSYASGGDLEYTHRFALGLSLGGI